MLNPPKTLEEAQAYRYGQDDLYDIDYCAYEVYDTVSYKFHQCYREPKTTAGLYCWQHAKMVEGE